MGLGRGSKGGEVAHDVGFCRAANGHARAAYESRESCRDDVTRAEVVDEEHGQSSENGDAQESRCRVEHARVIRESSEQTLTNSGQSSVEQGSFSESTVDVVGGEKSCLLDGWR